MSEPDAAAPVSIPTPLLVREEGDAWLGHPRDTLDRLPEGHELLPRLLGYQPARFDLTPLLAQLLFGSFLLGGATAFVGMALGAGLGALGVFPDSVEGLAHSVGFAALVGVLPLIFVALASLDRRPPSKLPALRVNHPEPTPRVQADLLAHLLLYLNALPGTEVRVEAPLRSEDILGWRVYLRDAGASGRVWGWITLNEDRGQSRVEVGLLRGPSASGLGVALAARPEAREALEALGLSASGLGLTDATLYDGRAVRYTPNLGARLPVAPRLAAITGSPPLAEDPARAVATLLGSLVAAAHRPLERAVLGGAPRLRLGERRGDLAAPTSCEVPVEGALAPLGAAPPHFAPPGEPRRVVWVGVIGYAWLLFMICSFLVSLMHNMELPWYLLTAVPGVLVGSAFSALVLSGDRPTWGSAPATELRASQRPEITLRVEEDRLVLGQEVLELARPFAWEWSRAPSLPDAASATLHLTLTQASAEGGAPRRLHLAVPGLDLSDPRSAEVPELERPQAYVLAPEDFAGRVLPALLHAAQLHGAGPRWSPQLLDEEEEEAVAAAVEVAHVSARG